jgi:signal transduction histidine kinase
MIAYAVGDVAATLARIFGWRRVRFALGAAAGAALLLGPSWRLALTSVLPRALVVGLIATLAFGAFERWPRRLPRWLARWVLQVVAVALAVPIGAFALYLVLIALGEPPFWRVPERLEGFFYLAFLGVLIAPWAALGALVREKDALARHQALEFDLARSELERQAVEARLRLLQAQVAPHFLFNSLANVQALVDAGSPTAAPVLRSLTTYLRAAVPRLHAPATTIGDELQLVEAYLALMHLRMPDRLRYAVHVDDDARALPCPPLTLLTLVENAIRHGIDPSEDGGRIDVEVERRADRCVLRVRDTGLGLAAATGGHGTGLATLRERLRLGFGDAAALRLTAATPRGVCAELELPTGGAGR